MSSSNKNWPSMFKSKPFNNNHHRHHHDTHNPSYIDQYPDYNISSSFSPDPKPRWNPKPEQIQILESIFNSGIVNPPRDEIQRIRIRLEEFGQIGDSNVFYWFQNRKSRAKHKLRALQENPKLSNKDKIIRPSNDDDPCFGLVNNQETGLFPTQINELAIIEPDGFLFPDQTNELDQSGFGFSDFVVPVVTEERMVFSNVNNGVNFEINESFDKIPESNFYGGDGNGGGNCFYPISVPVTVPLTTSQTQGDILLSGGEEARECGSPVRMMVFINDMPFEVVAGLFNVREAFGNEAVLINSFGQPILTDEFGVTLQPLQHGAVYYLI